ncbi:putative glutathione transferase transcription factor MYB family [Arabidopsis thaliana]
MDPYPYSHGSGFVNLLTSQQEVHTLETNPCDDVPIFSTQCTDSPSLEEHVPKVKRERMKWSAKEDMVLVSAWLNTSKDAVIGNEQKANTFWSRIAAYYDASPQLNGLRKRMQGNIKQRWAKINDGVCKFVGSYEAASREKSSRQNDNDVISLAHEIFNNDYGYKFPLEHAWRVLRHDQKWCSQASVMSKRRKCDKAAQPSTSQPPSHGVEEAMSRPIGVKAAKAKAKKTVTKTTTVEDKGNAMLEIQSIWEIKQKDWELRQKDREQEKEDFEKKDRLSKTTLLESLIAKKEPLTDNEVTLKNKLIDFLLEH